jgi:hypothetical protein
MKISRIKMNQAIKRYVDRLYLNILSIGQLNKITPRAKRNIHISFIENYYNKLEASYSDFFKNSNE